MKKNYYFLSLFLLLHIDILASENLNMLIAKSLEESSKKHNIEEETILSIANVESNLHLYAISVILKEKKANQLSASLKKNQIRHKVKRWKSKRMVSIDPTNKKEALTALMLVKRTGSLKYDLGFTQINKMKIMDNNWDEKVILTNVAFNIDKSAYILRGCMNIHRNSKDAIECYNKGEYGDYSSYNYFYKVQKSYKKLLKYAK